LKRSHFIQESFLLRFAVELSESPALRRLRRSSVKMIIHLTLLAFSLSPDELEKEINRRIRFRNFINLLFFALSFFLSLPFLYNSNREKLTTLSFLLPAEGYHNKT